MQGERRAASIMPSSAYCDSIPCDARMKSGTQLHSSFSELYHTVKPTDSNECWLWPLQWFGSWKYLACLRREGTKSPLWDFSRRSSAMTACRFLHVSGLVFLVLETLCEKGWPQGTVNGRWFFQFSSNSPTALNVHWGKNRPDGDQEWQSASRWRGHRSF